MERHRLRAYLILLVVYSIWGFASPIIKFTLGGVSPLLFLFYRFLISAAVAIPIFIISGLSLPKERRTLLNLLLYCLLSSSITLGLLFFGLKNTTVLDATLITVSAPLLISAAGVIYLREHVTKREKVGMAIALIGTIFTVIEPLTQIGTDGTRLSGNILILLYLLATVIPSIQAKVLLRQGITPTTLANLSFVIGFLTIAPVTFLAYGAAPVFAGFQNLTFPYLLGILYMALLSGTIAYTLANEAQKTIEVGEASVFTYLYPVLSAPLAVFWLKESITREFLIGAVVITAGVIIAEYKKSSLKTRLST